MANTYSTVPRIKILLNIDTSNTDDDANILVHLNNASRTIDESVKKKFYPSIDTRYFDYCKADTLYLHKPILELTSLITNSGLTAIPNENIFLMAGKSYNVKPSNKLSIDSSKSTPMSWSGTTQKSQQVTGIWGYHNDYQNAYALSGDTVQDSPLNVGAGSLTVADGNNFEVGQTLRIESEWLFVSGITGNALTVERGVNNSVDAEHIATTAIEIFKFMDNVSQACDALTVWLYQAQSSGPDSELQIDFDESTGLPKVMPLPVHLLVRTYRSST